jgi:6-phosphogluconolactonase (cycloisomerase 2 family)
MIRPIRVATGAVAGLLAGASVAAWGGAAAASPSRPVGAPAHVVFAQTDNLSGNQVVAYDRDGQGGLTLAASYDTGGAGGALAGSVVDHLASQGSLALDQAHSLLYAVNAGSDTVSVFSVSGDVLTRRQVIDSGGVFPVSVAVSGDLIYVLNALDGGRLSGFREAGGHLHAIENSGRSLGLAIPTDSSQFTHTPGQVAFSPDGSQLIVTTKANGNDIDVFDVAPNGRLSGAPVVNAEPGTVPFAVTFDRGGDLVVAEAGTNAVSTYRLGPDGSVTLLVRLATGQSATCWVASANRFLYASNTGSTTESGFAPGPDGSLTLLGTTGTDPGTVDAAGSPDGQNLYVQTGGNGVIDAFQVTSSGALTPIGSVVLPGGTGGEGIVAL